MKKLLLSGLSLLFLGFVATAQEPVKNDTKKFKAANDEVATFTKNKAGSSLGKAATSYWYEAYNFAGKAGAESFMKGYVNFLFPDSLTKYMDETGAVTYGPGSTNVGQVLDPKDDNIDLTDNPEYKMSKFTSYTLDSIYFYYLYVRNVDSVVDGLGNKNAVVDTLFIDYFVTSALTPSTVGGGTTPTQVYAKPQFNQSTRRPTGVTMTQTILLTSADSSFAIADASGNPESSWRIKGRQEAVPAGISINPTRLAAQNYAGFTMRFKPGHTYDTSSYMIYQKAGAAPGPRANYFGYRMLINEGTGYNQAGSQQVLQTKYYNSSIFAGKGTSYGTVNGWTGFIPGNAYFQMQYLQCGFLLSSTNVGVKELGQSNFKLGEAYPNPTNGQTSFVFNTRNNSDVKISIVNMVGQEVLMVANDNFAAGVNEVSADLSSLTPGVYFYTMTVDGQSQSQKLVVSK